VLFAASGIGNGSTFRMIPVIFLSERQRAAEKLPSAQAQAAKEGNVEAAAVLGLASAVGAYGGFFIPKSYGTAIALTGSPPRRCRSSSSSTSLHRAHLVALQPPQRAHALLTASDSRRTTP
jgi:nitrate/nitrite transporter NarK